MLSFVLISGSTQGPTETKAIGLGRMIDNLVLHAFAVLITGCTLALYSGRNLTYSQCYMLSIAYTGQLVWPPTLNTFAILGVQTGSSLYLHQLSYFHIYLCMRISCLYNCLLCRLDII